MRQRGAYILVFFRDALRKKAYWLVLLFGLSLTSAWSQLSLDSLFVRVEKNRRAAQVKKALDLLESEKERAIQANRLAEWQIWKAKCLSDTDSTQVALRLLEEATSILQIPEEDLLLAEALNIKGSIALRQNQWLAAEEYYRQALGIRETYLGPNNEKVADAHNNLGAVYYLQQQYEQALLHHQQALTIRLKVLEAPHPDLGSSYNNIAACYYDLGQIEAALEYNQQALEQRRASFAEKHPAVADSYNNLGNCYFDLYQLEAAIESHEKALSIRQALSLTADQAASHNNLGNCWLETGELNRAIRSFSQAIDFYEQAYGTNHPAIAEVAVNQGNVYLEVGAYADALRRFQLARFVIEDVLGAMAPARIPALLGQAAALQQLGACQRAIPIFQEVIQQLQTQLGADHPLLPDAYNNLGNCFFRQGAYADARTYYQKAVSAFKQQPGSTKSQASTLFNIGNTYQAQQQNNQALTFYEEATDLLTERDLLSDLYLKIQTARATAFAKNGDVRRGQSLLEIQVERLAQQSIAPRPGWIDLHRELAGLYKEEATSSSLEKALMLYEKAAELLDQLLIYNRSRLAKRTIRLDYFSLYENGIEVALQLAQEKQEAAFLESAFALSEKSKALLIREASNESEARSFAGVPDSILLAASQGRQQIAEYEQLLYEQADQLDSATLRAVEIELLNLRANYNKRVAKMERNFPAYFRMKYRTATPKLQQIQSAMSEEEAVLSYFLGDSTAFVFVIWSAGWEVYKLERAELDRRTIQLWDAISHFTGAQAADDYRLYAQQYTENAHQLFQQLIAPIEARQDLPEKITIIPDGILCYLPFDLLLRKPVEEARLFRFGQHNYLIRDYSFSYAYSVDRWWQAQAEKQQQGRLRWAGFAPAFPKGISQFDPLYYNEQEVKNIARLLSGDQVFIGEQASLTSFQEQVSRASVIHLATHGLANANRSDFAFLAFATKDSTDQLLYTQNLYAMDLHQVELVVLSACETGLGEALPGEGIMSLAHAFRYAGAKSIITTLWSIDDEKTSQIMLYFYQQLKKGLSKDDALRRARLQYLEENNGEYAHPFYWAAFVPMGDMEGITFVKNVNYLLLFSIFVLFLMVFLGWFFRRNARKQ